ncbi:MAG: hypothetical protein KJ767_03455, partial [Nanoarchaeota archaeon]|nr:hypothetical protein [Nanoarchaeota archaeon]
SSMYMSLLDKIPCCIVTRDSDVPRILKVTKEKVEDFENNLVRVYLKIPDDIGYYSDVTNS